MENNELPEHEYERYLDECWVKLKDPLPFMEWKAYWEKGELHLLED